jgi:hypothetical protein
MRLSCTVTDTTATVMTVNGGSVKWGGSGILTDMFLVASVGGDTAVAPTVSDSTREVFAMTSSDFTTASGSTNQPQKNESNSNFKAIQITGPLTFTATGLGSGSFTISAFVIPDAGGS